MPARNAAYLHGVDDLVRSTPVDLVLSHYGLPVPEQSSGEYRMPCVFDQSCFESKYGQLTVSLDDPANVIYCHSCEVRGNLLVLVHGLENRKPPTGGRLRGNEFKEAVKKLRGINGLVDDTETPAQRPAVQPGDRVSQPKPSVERNTPMRLSEHEAARALANLNEELVVEEEHMPPAVADYFRQRASWLTPDLMKSWGVGYLPKSGRSMFRGWIVYTHRDEQGEVLSYSGRNVDFDNQWRKWLQAGKPDAKKPLKHRYVKGYHRGQELYGQQANRLQQPHVAESLERYGLVVCEGMNDVIRLDALGVAAVGVTSNKPTNEQVAKLARFANQAAAGRILLMPDTDEEGESGAKELLWRLTEAKLTVQLGWSRSMHDGGFVDRQPEQLTPDEWRTIADQF